MNTAAEVMTALTSHDVKVVVEGDRVQLLFSADRPPPKALIEAARFHKQALRAILENHGETEPRPVWSPSLRAAVQVPGPDRGRPLAAGRRGTRIASLLHGARRLTRLPGRLMTCSAYILYRSVRQQTTVDWLATTRPG